MNGRGALVLIAGVALTACGSPYPGSTLGAQVQSWVHTTGFSASLRTLRGDGTHVRELMAGHDVKALRTDCDALVDDALGANQNLPTPDTTLSTILAHAYSSAAAAGRDCLAGAGGSAGPLARAVTELAAADSGYIKAEARIDDLDISGAR